MTAIAGSAETGAFVPIDSTCSAPALLPDEFDPYAATL
jgi:hypothetical protein